MERYVATTGSDTTGDGTIGNPYRTPEYALGLCATDDTVILRGGAYTGDFAIETAGVTLTGYPGETVTISSVTNDEGVMFGVYCNAPGITLRNLDISGGWYYPVKFEYGNGLVEDCKVHGGGTDCLKIVPECDDMIVRRCEIYEPGVVEPSSQGLDAVNTDRLQVQDCYIHDCASDFAIIVKGGSLNAVVERCRVKDCYGGIVMGQSTDEEFLDPVANPGCYEAIDNIVRNCLVRNTQAAGLATWAGLRTKFLNNTLLDTASDDQGAIFFYNSDHAPGTIRCADCTVENNVVGVSPANGRPAVYIQVASYEVGSPYTSDHNRYYSSGGPVEFWDFNLWPPDENSFFGDLAEWQAHINGDAASTEGDPGLDTDGAPVAGSACVGAGMTLGDVPDDILGNDRAAPYDIGAFAFASGTGAVRSLLAYWMGGACAPAGGAAAPNPWWWREFVGSRGQR